MKRWIGRFGWHVIALLLAALVAILLISGCGGGLNSLTGGSIPIGTTLVTGVVIDSNNPTQIVPDTNVVLVINDTFNQDSSDSKGHFDLGTVSAGDYKLNFRPPQGGSGQPTSNWDIRLPDDTRAQIVAAVLPNGFDPSLVDHVKLNPDKITLRVGAGVRFIPSAYDQLGNKLDVTPSLLLVGDVGDLASNGTITAYQAGNAKLTAWLNGKEITADVTVIP